MIRFVIITLITGSALFLWQRSKLESLQSQSIETRIEFRKLKASSQGSITHDKPSPRPAVSIAEFISAYNSKNEDEGLSLLERLTTLSLDEIRDLHATALASTSLTQRQRLDLAGTLVTIMAESGHPNEAADLAVQSPNAELILEHLFQLWGRQDPAAAQRWIDTATKEGKIEDGFESDHISDALAKGLAASDPLQALRDHVDADVSNDVLQEIAKSLQGEAQYLEYAKLVSQIPKDKSRRFGLRRLGANLTANLPVNEATNVLSELELTVDDRTELSVAYVSSEIDKQTEGTR